jgi:hypothetical protein
MTGTSFTYTYTDANGACCNNLYYFSGVLSEESASDIEQIDAEAFIPSQIGLKNLNGSRKNTLWHMWNKHSFSQIELLDDDVEFLDINYLVLCLLHTKWDPFAQKMVTAIEEVKPIHKKISIDKCTSAIIKELNLKKNTDIALIFDYEKAECIIKTHIDKLLSTHFY